MHSPKGEPGIRNRVDKSITELLSFRCQLIRLSPEGDDPGRQGTGAHGCHPVGMEPGAIDNIPGPELSPGCLNHRLTDCFLEVGSLHPGENTGSLSPDEVGQAGANFW
jgi:hypothetical protein